MLDQFILFKSSIFFNPCANDDNGTNQANSLCLQVELTFTPLPVMIWQTGQKFSTCSLSLASSLSGMLVSNSASMKISLILLSFPPPLAQWLRSQLLQILEKMMLPNLTAGVLLVSALRVATSQAAKDEIKVSKGFSMSWVLFSLWGQVIFKPFAVATPWVLRFLMWAKPWTSFLIMLNYYTKS